MDMRIRNIAMTRYFSTPTENIWKREKQTSKQVMENIDSSNTASLVIKTEEST